MMEIFAHPKNAFEDRKILVRRIASYVEHDYSPSHVLLNGTDYSKDNSVLDEFKDFAFYWNRNCPRGRVPAHVLDLMNDDLCRNLVWLSRRALEEEDVLFVWIVAHEFRHVYQAMKGFPSDTLRRISRDLWRRGEFRTLPSSPLGVAELDCDIFALQTAKGICGPELVIEFFGRRLLPRCPFQSYALYLQQLEVACRDNDC